MIYCKKYLLKEISSIRTGYVLRGKVPEDPNGDVNILLMKDVQPEGIDWEKLTKISPKGKRALEFLNLGDVLFSGRGTKIFAQAIVTQPNRVIASSQYFVISAQEGIPAEYLAWYINSKLGQRYFWKYAGGSLIINVTRETIENCPIPIPDNDQMELITQYIQSVEEERFKYERIQENRQKLIEAMLSNNMEEV